MMTAGPMTRDITVALCDFLGELEWYANALKVARAGGVPY